MKKFRMLLAMILIVSLLASAAAISAAEGQTEEWQADIHKLMREVEIPRSTSIEYEVKIPEGIVPQHHSAAIEKVNNDDIAMRIALNLIALEDFSGDDWKAMDEWLDRTATAAIQGVAVDTESMANVVVEAIASARKAAAADENGVLPVWGRDSWQLSRIEVTLPYYPELADGANGTATQRLQEALIRGGFLDDRADGFFGGNTRQAVEMLERHVRALEQDLIDTRPTPEPTPVPTPTPQPEQTMAVPEDIPITPEPTAVPLPTPVTPVDGVADALLQAYLFSGDFAPARSELKSGDKGDDVLRLQRRLAQLGCMTGTADGDFGGSTARSVRIFQYYNGLEQTGIADVAMQELLYSAAAKAPANAMLSSGAAGEDVKALQLRLRVLGFMNASVDGDYGNATVNGVKTLQRYMRDLEEQTVRADVEAMASLEQSGADISSLLTVEVNGIADPILLDDFYADSFPAIPAAMQGGSGGIDVVRLQRRLNGLEYYYGTLDGDYGAGTEKAVTDFQKRNGLEKTGKADEATLRLLFSEDALKALKPYVLKISTADQRVYAYGLDDNNEHTVLVRTMKCSTGKNETPTPKGTFQNGTGPGARWHYFKKFECWAQYAYYIDGDIMFHSVLYNEKDGPVTQSSVNNLGRKASHGCVRLSVEDAKWIYNNCPRNTKIVVY